MQKETDLNITISNLNATKIHLQFKENADLKEIETVFVCEDYGKFFLLLPTFSVDNTRNQALRAWF